MPKTYHDRMIRPPAGVEPVVTFVRERHRLIPIPVGPAATVPPAPPSEEDAG